jgi:hypothetical protein
LRVGHISLPSATVGDQWEHEAVRRAVEESGAEYSPDSDEVIVIGGGGLLYDRRGVSDFPLEDGWLERVRRAGRACAVSVEFGRPRTRRGREVYREILRRCSLVVVRDWESAENVRSLCGKEPLVRAPIVFSYPPEPLEVEVRYRYGLVLHFEAGVDYELLRQYASDSLMVPFAGGNLGNLPHEPNPRRSVEVAARSLASCEVVVTSRLHGLIMAALLGKRVVPLLNLQKVRYMARRLGVWSPFDFLPEREELDAFEPMRPDGLALSDLREEAEDVRRLLIEFLSG